MNDYESIPLPDYVELPTAEMQHRAEMFLEIMRKRHSVRDFSLGPSHVN